MSAGKKVSGGAMLVALALIFSYVESLIPVSFGIPGVKLGIANLVTVLGLYFMNPGEVLVIVIMRILLAGFMFGSGISILYSLAGGILSFLVMVLIKKANFLSMAGVSVAGGVTHNIGQIAVAAFVLQNLKIAYYLPVLIISGTVTGIVIGIAAEKMLSAVKKSRSCYQ